MSKRYYLTNHAVERFEERFGNMIEKGATAHQALLFLVHNAKPDRSFMNNTQLMVKLGEKYGYNHSLDIRVKDNIVFICRRNKVITLYDRHDSMYGNSRRSRFSCRTVQ